MRPRCSKFGGKPSLSVVSSFSALFVQFREVNLFLAVRLFDYFTLSHVKRRFTTMPYKDPEKRQEYMRRYMREYRRGQRKTGRKPHIETPTLRADAGHIQCLEQARGGAVATPQGRGTLLCVSGGYATVAVAGTVVKFSCEQVGLW
jgi:hypothetical protein